MTRTDADQALFSYGTLQLAHVQLDIFGHVLDGENDVLPGYTVDYAEGAGDDPVLRATGSPRDKVIGTVLRLTEEELEAADEYEVASWHRERVVLASGRDAWVYLPG